MGNFSVWDFLGGKDKIPHLFSGSERAKSVFSGIYVNGKNFNMTIKNTNMFGTFININVYNLCSSGLTYCSFQWVHCSIRVEIPYYSTQKRTVLMNYHCQPSSRSSFDTKCSHYFQVLDLINYCYKVNYCK